VLIRYTISRDDVYISIAGTIGAVGLVPDHLHEAHLTENAAKVVLQSAEINPKYLCYWLASPSSKSVIAASTIATTQPKLALFRIERIPFPFAPRPVQDRIVSEIEKQFTRLDSGIAVLRRVQANLKRYRAAVLKAACEGKLVPTEADLARQEGRTYETGAQLLDRILIERRQKWNGKGKYKEPAKPDLTKPSLPDGWVCASVEQITDNFDGRRVPLKSTERDKRSGPYPYYGASGIIDDIDDYLFNGEYLLIAEDGANLLSRSTPIAFKASGKFWVNNHAHIVQTAGGIPLAYLGIFLNGQDLKFFITGSAQPKLTQAALNRIFVPLPPYSEQLRIVAEVERRLSVVEELEAVVNTSLQRATGLRQSILQRAFEGTLIP
jgi:type I restriction enzyme S subunit